MTYGIYLFGAESTPDIGVQFTVPGAITALALVVVAYMLGKLAQIWLREKLRQRRKKNGK